MIALFGCTPSENLYLSAKVTAADSGEPTFYQVSRNQRHKIRYFSPALFLCALLFIVFALFFAKKIDMFHSSSIHVFFLPFLQVCVKLLFCKIGAPIMIGKVSERDQSKNILQKIDEILKAKGSDM